MAHHLRIDEKTIATHAQRKDALDQARNIATSGYYFTIPVGFVAVFEGRTEIAAYFHKG